MFFQDKRQRRRFDALDKCADRPRDRPLRRLPARAEDHPGAVLGTGRQRRRDLAWPSTACPRARSWSSSARAAARRPCARRSRDAPCSPARRQGRAGGLERRAARHARRDRQGHLPVQRDGRLLQVAGEGRRARPAANALHRGQDGQQARDLQVRLKSPRRRRAGLRRAGAGAGACSTVLDFEPSAWSRSRRSTPRSTRGSHSARCSRSLTAEPGPVHGDHAGHDGDQALNVFGDSLTVAFDQPQVTVSMRISGGGGDAPQTFIDARNAAGNLVDGDDFSTAGPLGRPSCCRAPASAPWRSAARAVSFLPVVHRRRHRLQRRRAAGHRDPVVLRTGASCRCAGNQPDAEFVCTLDGVSSPCRAPFAAGTDEVGAHVFTVAMRDRYLEHWTRRPRRTCRWTVAPPPVPQPATRRRPRRRARRP